MLNRWRPLLTVRRAKECASRLPIRSPSTSPGVAAPGLSFGHQLSSSRQRALPARGRRNRSSAARPKVRPLEEDHESRIVRQAAPHSRRLPAGGQCAFVEKIAARDIAVRSSAAASGKDGISNSMRCSCPTAAEANLVAAITKRTRARSPAFPAGARISARDKRSPR